MNMKLSRTQKNFVTIDDGGVHLTTKELDFELLHLSEDDRNCFIRVS